MLKMDAMFKLAEQIKGFLDPVEAQRLYEIADDAARMGPCLEIGSYCGKSAVFLGNACKKNDAILFSVDHHQGSEEQQPGEEYFDPELFNPQSYTVDTFSLFRRTLKLADLEQTVVALVGTSTMVAQAWATPLSLVFIDGGHAYETVLSDYRCWAKHVMPNGYLLIHDIFQNPAEGGQAPFQIYQKALASGLFHELPMTKTLGVLQRMG